MTFLVIFILIILVVAIFRFNNFRTRENAQGYYSITTEVKFMIDQEMVHELADLLVELELNDQLSIANSILKAIDYKGLAFARRVDKVRNELRIKKGLGRLKSY